MRADCLLALCICAVALSGCDFSQTAAQGESRSPSEIKSPAPPNGWTLDRKQSQLDGVIVVATKRVQTESSIFNLSVQCAGGSWVLKIDSYLSTGEPNPFLTKNAITFFGGVRVPDGRLKMAESKIMELDDYFTIADYNNVIAYRDDGVDSVFATRKIFAETHGIPWPAKGEPD